MNHSISDSDYIAIGAAVIALCAMVATIWQGALTRKHNRLSVRPHINVINQRSPMMPRGVGIKISIVNVGIGPAVVIDSYFLNSGVRVQFEKQRNQSSEILKTIFANELQYSCVQHSAVMKGAVIPAGEELVLVEATFGGVSYSDASVLDDYSKNVGYILEYKSFYGEKFKSNLSGVAEA